MTRRHVLDGLLVLACSFIIGLIFVLAWRGVI